MTLACRQALAPLAKDKAAHAALVLARCLPAHETSGEKQGSQKRHLIERARVASQSAISIYRKAYERWILETADHASRQCSTKGRLVIGLGTESPLETGLTLHHTYGTPLVPGSALKGLCRNYCSEVWRLRQDSELEGASHLAEVLFGAQDDAGHIIFQDAWITPESLVPRDKGLLLDVMTPHHPEYNIDPACIPTEFDSPVPVPFVSVAGEFRLALKCDVEGDNGRQWAEFSLKMLLLALKHWGVGGKTRAGYGRME